MKNFVKVLMPVIAFALASAGAVGSNAAKGADLKTKSGAIPAFIQNPSSSQCLQVTANCSEVNTHINCMSIENTTKRAYLKNSTGQCSVELFRVL